MINEQHEERESVENTDHDGSLIEQNPILFDQFATNSEAKEIREIVQTIAEAVFHIIDNNFDQLANRSSNTLGMRVKDSLILKVQQTRRKEIPFDKLKTSLVCSRVIVDDDQQTRFLPRIESLAPSSDSENLSTKQKKSVSLAEEVKVFNRDGNGFLYENEVGYLNELMDTQKDGITDRKITPENEYEKCDLTSQKSSTSHLESESSIFDNFNAVKTAEKSALFDRDQEIQLHLKTSDNSEGKSTISFNKTQTSDYSARDGAPDPPKLSIAPYPFENQLIVSLATETTTSKMDRNFYSDNEKVKTQEAVEVSKELRLPKSNDQLENVPKDRPSKRSKMANEDLNDETSLHSKEQIEPVDPIAPTKKSLVMNVDIETKFKGEESKISHNSYDENLNDDLNENSSATNVPNVEEIARKKCSKKNILYETLDIADKTIGEEKTKIKRVKKWINEFMFRRKKTTAGDESKAEDQLFKNPKLHRSSTIIAVVRVDSASAKLGPSQPALESNKEDKISEKGILSVVVNGEESQNDEDTFTPEAEFDFKRSSDGGEEINENEISDEKERPESLSKIKRADEDESAGNENVKSSEGDKGIHKLFKKIFAANVEGGNSMKLHIPDSQVQKHTNKNGNVKDVNVVEDTNPDTENENDPGSEASCICSTAVQREQSTERNISSQSVNKLPSSSSEDNGVDRDAIKATENRETVTNSEKRTSLFSKIIRSKNRTGKNLASEETAVTEKKQSKKAEINDVISSSFQRLSGGNSEPDMEDAEEASEVGKVLKENSDELLKIKTLSDEKLKIRPTLDTKRNNLTNSPPPKKTSSKVSIKANRLSKKSSRTYSSADQQSTNDPSFKQTSSKVSRKASKSSGKLSRTDISDVISDAGPNNPAAETFLLSFQDGNVPNQIDTLHVADTSASTEDGLESSEKFKSKKSSGNSVKTIQAQAYPVSADNNLKLDRMSSKLSQQQNSTAEIDKVEVKTSRSRWSLFGKKSSAKLNFDKKEISERENLGNDTAEDLAKRPVRSRKSMLDVVPKSSREGEGVVTDNLKPENDRDVTDNKSSKSFLNFESNEPRNKSEDAVIALQLHSVSVNINADQSEHLMEPIINTKKRNRFMEGLKRSLQSGRNRSKKSEGKSELKFKVSSESQTDMDDEFYSEYLTDDQLKNGNDIENTTRSSQLLDTKVSQSLAMVEKDLLIDGKEEIENVSSTDDEDSYPQHKSKSCIKFFERPTKEESEVSEATGLVEDVIQKSISEVSKQLADETPKNLVEVYSVAVDSDPQQNYSSSCKIADTSTSLYRSQDLGEGNNCDINENDTKSIPNEFELVLKSSEDSESKPEQTEKGNISSKVNKPFARLLKKLSVTDSSKGSSRKCLNDDELPKKKNLINESNSEKKSSKSSRSVDKKSSKEVKTSEENAVYNVEEEFSRKSESMKSEKMSETDSKCEPDNSTIQNSPSVFTGNSESVVLAYVVNPSAQDQQDSQAIIGDKVQFDSAIIENKTTEQQSPDLMRQDEEKHSLLSSIKSIFKSSNKSGLRKRSIVSIGHPENTDTINKSLHSLRTNEMGGSASEIEVEKEQSVHFMRESVEIPMIQSMKSLQDNRKRSKNRRRSGHKLFNDKDTPVITENIVRRSYQATVRSDFMLRPNEDDKTEDLGVHSEANTSEQSVTASNSQTLLTDEEVVEEKTAEVPERRKKSKQQQNPEGSTKKFAISLSRIFSNSRKRSGVKNSRAATDSQINPEDHFEITKIPLSSSDDSSVQGNVCNIIEGKSDLTEDNREELVAVKSLDSMHDSDCREPIVRLSSRVLESKYATKVTNDQLLGPERSGTVIFSAPLKVNEISSENELAKKDSFNNFQETMRKPSEKIYVAKGTIVSYAPMVESAKYISDDRDDRSNENDRSEKRWKRSSARKSLSTIRKLFSRASVRSRQDHAAVEDHSVDLVCHEDKNESLNSVKSSIIKNRKDHSVEQLNGGAKRESIISVKTSSAKSVTNDEDENEERQSYPEIKKQLTSSKARICPPGDTDDIEGPVVYDKVLLVNNVEISRVELPIIQNDEDRIDVCENGPKPAVMKSNEVDIAENKVEPNHGGSKPTEIVERVALGEIVIPAASQTDLNKLSQRSSDTKKGGLLSTAKSYIKRRNDIEKEEIKVAKRRADEKNRDEDSVTPSAEDLRKTLKEQGVAKTESVLSRGLKRMFKKRSSVASNNCVENPANDIHNSLNIQTLSHLSTNNSIDVRIETEIRETKINKTKGAFDDLKLAVYNVNSKTKCPDNYDESRKRLENESSIPLVISETRTTNSFRTQDNPESETHVKEDETVSQNQFQTKIESRDFRLNPSFASRKSTIVMMATPLEPRNEPQSEVSRNESSNSPTAFYYLLGPSLDEALVDVRVVFQNLIDKITGRGR